MDSTRWKQLGWLAAAVVLAVGAGLMQRPLDDVAQQYDLASDNEAVAQDNPELAVLTVVPGGLRAPVVNYLWMRSQDLKEKGRIYDAMQLAEAICTLMPRFPGVWSFHAWNMAWNISVTTHTPDERWKWVSNGLELLRDRGIPQNPDELILYKELGWLLLSKMGGTTDEMHMVYKTRWASLFQRVLGTPPAGTTAEVIDAFRPIAQAPLDTSIRPDQRRSIQPGALEQALADPNARAFADALAELDVAVGPELLRAYNEYSMDPAVAVVRVRPPEPQTDRQRALALLINNPDLADGRAKLLALVRAHTLYNQYRMDPGWMLAIMESYNVPIDWRLVWPHGLYWMSYGLERTAGIGLDALESIERADPNAKDPHELFDDRTIDVLNSARIALNCLKDLTWQGRLTYRENPEDPDSPDIAMTSDWRYIEPTHQLHLRMIEAVLRRQGKIDQPGAFEDNILKGGHMNYLISSIGMLVAGRQLQAADEYFQWLKDNYKLEGQEWEFESVERFVLERMYREGSPIPDVARSQITASLQTAFVALARGDAEGFRDGYGYARRIYNLFESEAVARVSLGRPLEQIAMEIAYGLLIEPRQFGYNLSLTARSEMYRALPSGLQVPIYHVADLEGRLRRQARLQGVDFELAFPAPEGLEAYRQRLQQQQLGPLDARSPRNE
jgi:hypothetical protein